MTQKWEEKWRTGRREPPLLFSSFPLVKRRSMKEPGRREPSTTSTLSSDGCVCVCVCVCGLYSHSNHYSDFGAEEEEEEEEGTNTNKDSRWTTLALG